MTHVNVTVEHAGAHEPSGETFADDFRDALSSALADAGLKRGTDFDSKIGGYTQTSGVSTVYDVEVQNTEPSAAAIKAQEKADAEKAAAAAAPVVAEKPAKG